VKIAAIYTDWVEWFRRPRLSGCSYYRIAQPAAALKKAGVDIDLKGEIVQKNILGQREDFKKTYARLFGNYDIAFVQHVDSAKAIAQLFAARDYYKKKVILDIDDDVTSVHPSSPTYQRFYEGSPLINFTTRALEFADAISVSSDQLARVYSKYNKKVYVIPNRIDPGMFDYSVSDNDTSKIRIGWAGGIAHEVDLRSVINSLKIVMTRYPNTHFVHCGGDLDTFKELPEGRRTYLGYTKEYQKWPKMLARMKLDIAIAPLIESKFNRAKSYIKYLEYSIYGIPTVASGGRGLPYDEVIVNGQDGFLAKDYRDWDKYLSLLIENKSLRKQIGQTAKRKMSCYGIDSLVDSYKTMFSEVGNGCNSA